MKRTGIVIGAFLLIVTVCATTTEVPPAQSQPISLSRTQPAGNYYYSDLLEGDTVRLGDTSVRPPVLFKEYAFRVGKMPLLARLKAEIYHQGSGELPIVRVNGKYAGTLSPHWNDLSSQNYNIIFFDKNEGYSQALDYNDWITADLFISPDILAPGDNSLVITTARAGTSNADDIGLRNIEIEFRYLDHEDRVTDLRNKSRKLPLPYVQAPSTDGTRVAGEKTRVDTDTREKNRKNQGDIQAFEKALEISNRGIRKQQDKNTKGERELSGKTAVSAKALKRGEPVPDFQAKTLDGQTISLKDFRGKVVLLDFWATWCGPCRPEIPKIREAYIKYHDRGFEVIGVSLDKDLKKLEAFIDKNKVDWPQIFDGKGWNSALAKLYGVRSIPRPILLDRETRVYMPNARGKHLDRALEELFKR